jgi:putative phage-type endonuclease
MEVVNRREYDDTLLPQGSDLWLQTRRKYGTASEASAAMGVSPWIPKTPLQLWELKNGELEIKKNFAMTIGNEFEDEARECFQNKLQKVFEPCCIVGEIDGMPLMASLDGKETWSNINGTRAGKPEILEIKVPLNGSESPLWNTMVEDTALPHQYEVQMEQQMMLAEQDKCHFWVYDRHNKEGKHRIHYSIPELREEILDAWKEYFKGKPEPGPNDILKREDEQWKELAFFWKEARDEKLLQEGRMETMKKELITLCEGHSHQGAGVRVRYNEDKDRWTITKIGARD